MHLLVLPVELVVSIAENLGLARDILSLTKTNRQLYHILRPILYKFNVRQQNSSALPWLAKRGNPEIAETFICEYGADVNAIHEHDTPLIWAAKHGSISVVRVLLRAQNIDINFRNHNRETALWCAANRGHTAVVEELIGGKDIEIDCQDTAYGLSPLATAAVNGHAEIARRLLSTGRADINKQDSQGRTPTFLAMLFRNEELVKDMLAEETLDLSCRDNQGRTLLSFAALRGELSVVRIALRKGAEVNVVDNRGETPLDKAIINGSTEVTEAILEELAKFSSSPGPHDSHGVANSLFIAAGRGHTKITRLLLDHGFDVNARDRTRQTPLHVAVGTESSGVVMVLLGRQDIDVNAQDIEGITPLHRAVQRRHVRIIESLLRMDQLDPNLTDHQGRTPLTWAVNKGDQNTVELLLTRPDTNQPRG